MVFKSLRGMNTYLHSQEGRIKFGCKKDTRWFDERFSFVGILRHDASTNSGREAANAGNVCQLFATGFRATCYDIFQAYEHKRNAIGPEIKDVLQVVLKRFAYHSELNRVRGVADSDDSHFWQLCPLYSKFNEDASIFAAYNPRDGSCGETYRIGTVAAIYGVPANVQTARAIARNYAYTHRNDGAYKADLIKLRRIEIEVCTT
jgi:hypothetical protein